MMSLYEEYSKRGLAPHHVFIATLLALLRRYGALNFGIVINISQEAGRKLGQIALKERGGDIKKLSIPELIQLLNSLIDLNQEIKVDYNGEKLVIKARRSACKLCPSCIAESELPGKLCPYVGLIEGFIEELSGFRIEINPQEDFHRKEKDFCIIKYGLRGDISG